MARAGARVRGARSGRVGSSGGFCRGDGHEPARELVGEFGRRRGGRLGTLLRFLIDGC